MINENGVRTKYGELSNMAYEIYKSIDIDTGILLFYITLKIFSFNFF